MCGSIFSVIHLSSNEFEGFGYLIITMNIPNNARRTQFHFCSILFQMDAQYFRIRIVSRSNPKCNNINNTEEFMTHTEYIRVAAAQSVVLQQFTYYKCCTSGCALCRQYFVCACVCVIYAALRILLTRNVDFRNRLFRN